jgi:cholest-4-en-3-one 26-monooxygenase
MIGSMEAQIRSVASSIISEAVDDGEVDFVVDMASKLPLVVITDIMGVPAEDRAKVFQWTNQLIGVDDPEYNSSTEDAIKAGLALYAYAHELAEEARLAPRDDIISELVSADVDGERLSDMDFNRFFELLIFAGNETTRTSIANGMKAFLDYPEQFERLRDDPTLIDGATSEILRWSSPVVYVRRTVSKDCEHKGVPLHEGDKVSVWFPSANRDEDVFSEPFRFDIARDPNPYLTFGAGPHHCLGVNLARLEIRVFFSELIERVQRIEALGPATFLRSNFLAGIKHLPVRLEARS